jgi:hypothetical protein
MTFANICQVLDHLDPTLDDNQIVSILHSFDENQTVLGCNFLSDVRQHAIIGGSVCPIS